MSKEQILLFDESRNNKQGDNNLNKTKQDPIQKDDFSYFKIKDFCI